VPQIFTKVLTGHVTTFQVLVKVEILIKNIPWRVIDSACGNDSLSLSFMVSSPQAFFLLKFMLFRNFRDGSVIAL
jgi:hypothetical protein